MLNEEFPDDLAIRVRDVGKTYRLGVINRGTLRDEIIYHWLRLRGRDPKRKLGRIGGHEHTPLGLFHALSDVSFDIQKGETVGLIGRNGAGKSTMLKILARITTPSSGEAWIRGRVGSLLEVGTGFHPELTGRENIYLNGTILGMSRQEIDAKFDEIVEFSEIGDFLDTPVKRYSSGMYVKLAFSIASSLDNDVLLLDEVLAVGDAAFRKKSLARMKEIAASGRTILFVSHSLGDVQSICSRCILFDHGEIAMDGDTNAVLKEYGIRTDNPEPTTRSVPAAASETQATGEAILKGFDAAFDWNTKSWRFTIRYATKNIRYKTYDSSDWGWPRVVLSIYSARTRTRPLFVLDSDCSKGCLPVWIPAIGKIDAFLSPEVMLPSDKYSVDIRLLTGQRLLLQVEDAARFSVSEEKPPFNWRRMPFRPSFCWVNHSWAAKDAGSRNCKKS